VYEARVKDALPHGVYGRVLLAFLVLFLRNEMATKKKKRFLLYARKQNSLIFTHV